MNSILEHGGSRLSRAMMVVTGTCVACSSAAAGITGTYTGTYSSFNSGGDSGTATVTIDAYGSVGCDFFSTSKGIHLIASGSANASPGGTMYGSAPGQPSPVPIPLTTTSVNCFSGPHVSFGTAPPQPVNFAAQVVVNWAPAQGVVSYEAGSWINADGDTGQFALNFQPASAPNAVVNPAAVSGLWYDPSFAGSGFNITGSTVGLIATYYGWDKAGNRLWLSSAIGPSKIVLGQSLRLDLVQTTGGNFNSPAPPSTNVSWGTLTLTFNTCTSATAALEGSDGTSFQSLTLLAGLTGLGCQ